jgi:hypothetical protein
MPLPSTKSQWPGIFSALSFSPGIVSEAIILILSAVSAFLWANPHTLHRQTGVKTKKTWPYSFSSTSCAGLRAMPVGVLVQPFTEAAIMGIPSVEPKFRRQIFSEPTPAIFSAPQRDTGKRRFFSF